MLAQHQVEMDHIIRNPHGINAAAGEWINGMVAAVHERNVAAGWWTDINTGESLKGKRNVGELLCLVHSELSEGFEGFLANAMDDKLPHRPMFEVELADVLIRVFDLAGGLSLNLGGAFVEINREYGLVHNLFGFLLSTHLDVSRAMEGHRKGVKDKELRDRPMIEVRLAHVVARCFEIARTHGLDLAGAYVEKQEFNATRADHKLESRRGEGGKRY